MCFLFADKAAGTKQINVFMRGIYSSDVLMRSSVGATLATALRDFIRAYMWEAYSACQLGLQYFGLYPKLHSLHEIAHELRRQTLISPWCVNPAAHSCSLDEDFIGRVAVISRQVSPRLIPMRTIQRYLAHINIAWARVYEGQEIWKGARAGGGLKALLHYMQVEASYVEMVAIEAKETLLPLSSWWII